MGECRVCVPKPLTPSKLGILKEEERCFAAPLARIAVLMLDSLSKARPDAVSFRERRKPENLGPFSPGFIENLPLFRDLTTTQIETARCVIASQRLETDTLLVGEDQAGDQVFLLIEGSVKIFVTKGEQEVVLALRGRGEIIGELVVLDGNGRSASVLTQTPCVVGAISRYDFWNTLWEMPPVPYNVAVLLAERVRRLTARLQAMATLDVRGRIAFQLATMVAEHAVINAEGAYEIPFSFTQHELARMVGTSRAQTNQSLASWKRSGAVQTVRNHLIVRDLAALHKAFPAALFVTPAHNIRPFDFNQHFKA